MWVANHDLPRSAAHPFYTRLNQLLDEHDFDGHVEGLCQRFYAGRRADAWASRLTLQGSRESAVSMKAHETVGPPAMTPGVSVGGSVAGHW